MLERSRSACAVASSHVCTKEDAKKIEEGLGREAGGCSAAVVVLVGGGGDAGCKLRSGSVG